MHPKRNLNQKSDKCSPNPNSTPENDRERNEILRELSTNTESRPSEMMYNSTSNCNPIPRPITAANLPRCFENLPPFRPYIRKSTPDRTVIGLSTTANTANPTNSVPLRSHVISKPGPSRKSRVHRQTSTTSTNTSSNSTSSSTRSSSTSSTNTTSNSTSGSTRSSSTNSVATTSRSSKKTKRSTKKSKRSSSKRRNQQTGSSIVAKGVKSSIKSKTRVTSNSVQSIASGSKTPASTRISKAVASGSKTPASTSTNKAVPSGSKRPDANSTAKLGQHSFKRPATPTTCQSNSTQSAESAESDATPEFTRPPSAKRSKLDISISSADTTATTSTDVVAEVINDLATTTVTSDAQEAEVVTTNNTPVTTKKLTRREKKLEKRKYAGLNNNSFTVRYESDVNDSPKIKLIDRNTKSICKYSPRYKPFSRSSIREEMTMISSAASRSNDIVTDVQETSDTLDRHDCEEMQATEDTIVTADNQERQELPTLEETADSQDRQEVPTPDETEGQERQEVPTTDDTDVTHEVQQQQPRINFPVEEYHRKYSFTSTHNISIIYIYIHTIV